jgi:antitoxin component of MazEF toxin-antitoxin module
MRFRTTVLLGGKTATGLQIPDDVVTALGSGQRPKVHVTVGGHTYRTTVARMGGMYLVPLNAENRQAAGVAAGDEVDVDVDIDAAPRVVEVPADLAAAVAGDAAAQRQFDTLSFTHRKEWVRWVEEAKRAETRRSRIEKAVAALHDGKQVR